MKHIILILTVLLTAGCGNETVELIQTGKDGASGVNGTNGTNGTDGIDGSNGNDGSNGTNGSNSLVSVIDSESCESGGITVLAGVDTNNNNVLDDSEITSAQDVCNGGTGTSQGLHCNVHDLSKWNGSLDFLPAALSSNPPVGSFVLPSLNIPDSPSKKGFPGMPKELQDVVGLEGYALDCYGHLFISTSGLHDFSLLSDDGSRLVIEDNVLIENQGLHAPKTVTVKNVELHRGFNRINVVYFQGPHTQVALELKMKGPNTANQVIPSGLYSHLE